MHTEQARWLEGQARGQQGGCGVRPGAASPGAPGPTMGVQPPLALPPAPLPWPDPAVTMLPPGLALQPAGLVCMHFVSKVDMN